MTQLTSENSKKVHLISLGCARNRVDSEVMLGGLVKDGWAITDDATGADAVVVNTCGFIGAAKEESIDTILEIAEMKKDKPGLKLVVTGCLTQRYKTQLSQGLPEVDLFIGTDEFVRLPSLIGQDFSKGENLFAKRTSYLYQGDLPKINTLTKASAYVKVAEGCQHQCAFCIIPAIRGPLRSRPVENVVKEVKVLVANGVLEVNLIAQDLAAYGRDQKRDDLLPLLRQLENIDGLEWVRMLYVYPEHITDEFLDFFANSKKLVKYLDIPVQHGSSAVLKRMKRCVTRDDLEQTIARVRKAVPGINIRTTVMVGFPGETQAEFEELRDLVQEQRFEHLGCFAYSREEGTVAARYPDQIAEAVKKDRQEEIMAIQKNISRELLRAKVGQTFPVLVEGLSDETDLLLKGRIATQAPEVDGVVLINEGVVAPGTIAYIKITDSLDYDLIGQIIN